MDNHNIIIPVILAGGFGTRLWPLSRNKLPKQFYPLYHRQTMLQKTLLRLKDMKIGRPIIICNNEHKFLVNDQVSEINIECETILEPSSKNTAASIALVALSLKTNKSLLVLAADHFIRDESVFKNQILFACQHLKNNKIITFGVKPSSANTNYGYIETEKQVDSVFKVLNFREKPSKKIAEKYFINKNFFWNSGIFLFKTTTIINELSKYSPEILEICRKTIKTQKIDNGFKIFDKKIFSKCPNKSIDYAIMEYTKIAIMIPLNTKWSDVGSWNSLREISKKDKTGNVVKGDVVSVNTENSLIYALSNKLIATNNIKDLIVVDTKDSLLVSSIDEIGSTRTLMEKIKKQYPKSFEDSLYEKRPWGFFETIIKEPGYLVKKITVKPGGKLSVQKHKFRSEHWIVISGSAEVTRGKEQFTLNKNESTFIPFGEIHSLGNKGKKNLTIIEIQMGSYIGEDDIERFSDHYGRT